ncbi:MAG: hypothetical protein HUJ26_19530 [Planctomycetaceae bacterium]|nr:hypothetical protein [Planctomycetaceae bacterium]
MTDDDPIRKMIVNGQNKLPSDSQRNIEAGQMKSMMVSDPQNKIIRPEPPQGSGGGNSDKKT